MEHAPVVVPGATRSRLRVLLVSPRSVALDDIHRSAGVADVLLDDRDVVLTGRLVQRVSATWTAHRLVERQGLSPSGVLDVPLGFLADLDPIDASVVAVVVDVGLAGLPAVKAARGDSPGSSGL